MKSLNFVNQFFAKILCFALIMTVETAPVYAESGIMPAGNAAVTGFSGTVNSATEDTLFDINGPSLRIITLPGAGPFGLIDTLKPYTITAGNIGQVFGVTQDNASPPNIYVAATSIYGLAIYKPNTGRLKHGVPGSRYMTGQFGPLEQGGGPGSIWRVDGVTGKVTLFANVIYNGIENTPAALGGLAFDPLTQQLFVTDRATGMIHRFTLDGTDKGVFDHGVQGLTMVGQQAVPFDPATLAYISKPNFDTENPKTWGLAPEPRRVFALAVHGHRLYYSVYGPQIWSVGIAADGSFVDDVRFEVDSPALQQDVEVASITFDVLGSMYIAERGAPTGDYNFMNIANSGQARVKRFTPKTPTNASPTFWAAPGDEYAIGMAPEYQNADGGVTVTCGRTLWVTGDRLLDTGADSAQYIDGLQGNDKDLTKPANTPPLQSWFINYYDTQSDPNSRGHMGAIVNNSFCTAGHSAPAIPAGFSCSSGTCLVDGFCYVAPICPAGTIFQDGYCTYPNCPWGFVIIDGICLPPPIICDYGTVYIDGYCVPWVCPPGLEWAPYGYCHCPDYTYYNDGTCAPPPPCPPEQTYIDGRCVPSNPCPPEQIYQDGYCYPQTPCPPEQTYINGSCVPNTPCPPDQMYRDGSCTPTTPCPPGQTYNDGRCTPDTSCPPNQIFTNGRCTPATPATPACPEGQVYRNGHCLHIIVPGGPHRGTVTPPYTPQTTTQPCPAGQVYRGGHCIRIMVAPPGGPHHGAVTPSYTPQTPTQPCPAGQVYRGGHCIRIMVAPPGGPHHGAVTPPYTPQTPTQPCPAGQVYRGGHCIRIMVAPPGGSHHGTVTPPYPSQRPHRVTPPANQPSYPGHYQPSPHHVTPPMRVQQRHISPYQTAPRQRGQPSSSVRYPKKNQQTNQ